MFALVQKLESPIQIDNSGILLLVFFIKTYLISFFENLKVLILKYFILFYFWKFEFAILQQGSVCYFCTLICNHQRLKLDWKPFLCIAHITHTHIYGYLVHKMQQLPFIQVQHFILINSTHPNLDSDPWISFYASSLLISQYF